MMKLSFSTLGCPEWRWDEIIATAKDLGYEGIEIRGVRKELYVPRIKQLMPENIRDTKTQLKNAGLEIPVLTSACELHNAACRDDTIFACKEYVDVAADIGKPYVRVLADKGAAPSEHVDVGLVRESAQLLGAYAASKGVTLLIESNGVFSDTEKLAKLIDEIGSPGVAALWDINHPVCFQNEPAKVSYDNLKDIVKHVHIKDSIKQDGKVLYRIIGRGTLPVTECVELLQQGGFDGYYSLEWLRRWDVTLEEPGISFAHYAQYMRGL